LKFEGIRNFIFDLDGTLIDSSEGVVEATNYGLISLGESPRTPDEIRKYIGYPLEDMFRAFSDKSYQEFWRLFQQKGLEVIAASSKPLDGAHEVLTELIRRKRKIGIGTTKISAHVGRILARFNWQNLISCYIGADNVDSVKPHPETFLKLKELLGGNSQDTIVVGDTAVDVRAARAASLRVFGIKSPFGGYEELEKSRPDIILDNLKDLLLIV
jgi:HAD superfamily hydrolase (TIGR01549 family)